MKFKYLVFTFLAFLLTTEMSAQFERDSNLIQFSGMVLDGSNEQLMPIPYTNIFIKDSGRGTYSDFSGFFSIVAEKGEEVEFSAIGYQTVVFYNSRYIRGSEVFDCSIDDAGYH